MADTYFKIYALGLLFQFGYNIIAAILRGIGDSKATLYFLLIASVINIVLDIILVYNFQMGVVGAAVATDIAQGISCVAGFPMALQQLIVSFGFVSIQRAVNNYGEAMTASFSVAQKIETYMTLPANALMTTQSTYTGQNIGAGRVIFVFAKPIVAAFGLGSSAAGYCVSHVRCVAICLIPFASYFPLLGLFQGANNALYLFLMQKMKCFLKNSIVS